MSEQGKGRRRRGEQFWAEQLRGWERSGLSLRAYAQGQGLSAQTASRWRKRLQGTGKQQASMEAQAERWARLPVRRDMSVASSARYRVHLPNGVAVEVSGPIEESELGRLLRVVSGR